MMIIVMRLKKYERDCASLVKRTIPTVPRNVKKKIVIAI